MGVLRKFFTSLLLMGISAVNKIAEAVEIGDTVSVEGYVMDDYCIQRGTLLDRSSVQTLVGPDQHSVHCLVDVSVCRDSSFEILLDPVDPDNQPLYTRGYRVDEAGKDMLIALARAVGRCSTCTGNGDQAEGFRALVNGTVSALADGDTPPGVLVTSVDIPDQAKVEETTSSSLDILRWGACGFSAFAVASMLSLF